MSVKRYWSYAGGDSSMQETETGNYVKYEDYASLERKNIELAVQLANAESKCREMAEFKSSVYAQVGAGCDAPEFSITEGLSNLRRFADTLHAIEREFFTKEVPDEECEGETVEECPLCWGMTVEQYVSEFGKCLAEVRAHGVELFASSLKVVGGHEHPYSAVANEFASQLRKGAAHHCSHCGGIDTCSEHGCTATDQMIERYRASKGAAL